VQGLTKKIEQQTGLVFPHQLFAGNPLLKVCSRLILVEEWLFFRQYPFHKQKIAFHRASMKYYESYLKDAGKKVVYISISDKRSDIRELLNSLKEEGVRKVHYIEVTDDWLHKRITQTARNLGMELKEHPSALFVVPASETSEFLSRRKTLRQTDFYISQRRKKNILLTEDGEPLGGKWTYDTDNRRKYPSGSSPPKVLACPSNVFTKEAISYTGQHFARNPGNLSHGILYPVTHQDTLTWFKVFLDERFFHYGRYQDAILHDNVFIHHSVVSPMLNVGLITPTEVLDLALKHSAKHSIPLNSTEGFTRQVLGWREFIRGVYQLHGSLQRSRNFWGFSRKIPASFWDGSTGILPVDNSIHKVIRTGYCHHIERLMVLSNFMLLCEFHPDEVYRWFMELFVDAYDWVMVPNVYGMGQFADGGLMSGKPYISGSNYLKKMADYAGGDWQQTWDALFWRFIHKHRDFFGKNPRMRMMVATLDKMDPEKKEGHLKRGEAFLQELDAAMKK
jgi:deoxyribodipyrimidine photolyase-related protein